MSKADSLTAHLQLPTYRRKWRGAQLLQPRRTAGLPVLNAVVVVEGPSDFRAVAHVVCAPILIFGGASRDKVAMQLAKQIAALGVELLVLADPDMGGRQWRTHLDEAVGPCWHAFLPGPEAVATQATRWHGVGSLGVENAPPDSLRRCLRHARRSRRGEPLWRRQDLEPLGLAQESGANGGDVKLLRLLVCSYLGLGACDGAQLVKQLNRFAFRPEDVQRELEVATRRVAYLRKQHAALPDDAPWKALPLDELDLHLYAAAATRR